MNGVGSRTAARGSSRAIAVVPTLGWSELVDEALAALRASGGNELQICLVWQGAGAPPAHLTNDRVVHRLLCPGKNLGFSGAVNLALIGCDSELVALVNDDAVVEPAWFETLAAALAEEPELAAAQGVNLDASSGGARLDGCGLGWNRLWQAVQVGRGDEPPHRDQETFEVFGVSATAALFRRAALEAAAARRGEILDSDLFAYYEDVDLACRLRARGGEARAVPKARASHGGSTTGRQLGDARWTWIHAHRLLVLARLLGRGFWPRLPGLLARDFADAARGEERPRPAALLAAWRLALARLPRFARRGAPLVPLAELARLRVGSDGWSFPHPHLLR